MRVQDFLLTIAPPQVGMDHAAGDGSGAHDADLDHQVVVVARLQAPQHGHLGAALDLKHPHRVAAADHFKGRGVSRGHGSQGKLPLPVPPQEIEAEVQVGEGAQPQQVYLEQAGLVHVFLVPLNDRPARHGGVLDRHQVVDGAMTQQKAPGMDGEVTWEVLNLFHQRGQMEQGRVAGIESGLPDELGVPVIVGHQLGQAVQAGGRNPQHLAHLPDGGPTPVTHHVGHHGGTVAPVLFVDMLDHLFAAVVLDVQVDIRRLGPLPGQKALEEEIHLGRVHAGDPQGKTDRRVGGRPASLAEDVPAAAVLHDLVHGQEVAFVLQLPDEIELLSQLWNQALELFAQAAGGSLEGPVPQVPAGGLSFRQRLQWIAVTQFLQRKGTAGGHLQGPPDRLRIVAEETGQFLEALEGVLVVGTDEPAGRGQGGSFPYTGQNVLQAAPFRSVIEDLHGCHGREAEPARQLSQLNLRQDLLRPAVSGQQDVEAVFECRFELPQKGLEGSFRRSPGVGRADPQGKQAAAATAHRLPV